MATSFPLRLGSQYPEPMIEGYVNSTAAQIILNRNPTGESELVEIDYLIISADLNLSKDQVRDARFPQNCGSNCISLNVTAEQVARIHSQKDTWASRGITHGHGTARDYGKKRLSHISHEPETP